MASVLSALSQWRTKAPYYTKNCQTTPSWTENCWTIPSCQDQELFSCPSLPTRQRTIELLYIIHCWPTPFPDQDLLSHVSLWSKNCFSRPRTIDTFFHQTNNQELLTYSSTRLTTKNCWHFHPPDQQPRTVVTFLYQIDNQELLSLSSTRSTTKNCWNVSPPDQQPWTVDIFIYQINNQELLTFLYQINNQELLTSSSTRSTTKNCWHIPSSPAPTTVSPFPPQTKD